MTKQQAQRLAKRIIAESTSIVVNGLRHFVNRQRRTWEIDCQDSVSGSMFVVDSIQAWEDRQGGLT